MLQAVVFDLDDTLLDTSEILIPIAHSGRFQERLRRPLPLMPGAKENLAYLASRYKLFLLTLGNRDIQNMKIESLGIRAIFQEVFLADAVTNETKEPYFQMIAQRHNPSLILSIGNRRTQDVRLAKKQGLRTCLFSYGEHSEEQPSLPEDYPDFQVQNHFELVRRCQL